MRVENGVIVGSNGKYQSRNPIARRLLSGFDRAVSSCIEKAKPSTVLEIGCGEGHVTELILRADVLKVLATDISLSLVQENIDRIKDQRVEFMTADLMNFPVADRFDLVVCCEVLEHLEDPVAALDILHKLEASYYLLSVPREPIWRIMNMCRGAYLSEFGNSPGHIKHFSTRGFIKLIERKFLVTEVQTPLPWTVVLCKPR